MIGQFENEYHFMSNFADSKVVFGGITYPTVEHAFQAAKTHDKALRFKIAKKATAGLAKKAGRELVLREDWEDVKFGIMYGLVFYKFATNNYLANKLRLTGDHILIEGNYWHDNVWGDCTCAKCANIPGTNFLGKILMAVREELNHGRL